jgi:hypothetical protein
MATYKDPVKCFAPMEVLERLLEIRSDMGFTEAVYVDHSSEVAEFLDAYGFDVYSFSEKNQKIDYGLYRSMIVPSGDSVHSSATIH